MHRQEVAPTYTVSEQSIYNPTIRRRGLFVVLADNFLMNCGFFMVIRLLSVHYVEQLGWTAASIGLVLALRQFLQQGTTPISGILADRFGPKVLICSGLFIRVFSFVFLSMASSFGLLLLSAILMGLAGSLFEAPIAATIAALTEPGERNRFYSLYGITSELGTVIGVQLGVLLLSFSFSWTAIGGACCFFLASAISFLLLPAIQMKASSNLSPLAGARLVLHDRSFMAYTFLLMGFWFMWVQLTIALPLAVKAINSSDALIGLVYGLSSGITVLFGYPLLRFMERYFSPFTLLIGGITTMALGFGSLAFMHSVPLLLLSVVVTTLGILLAMPCQRTVAAKLAHPQWLGTYLGMNALALGIGGAGGNYMGGALYDLSRQLHLPGLTWLVIGSVGLLTAFGLVFLFRYIANTRDSILTVK